MNKIHKTIPKKKNGQKVFGFMIPKTKKPTLQPYRHSIISGKEKKKPNNNKHSGMEIRNQKTQ